MLNRGMAACRLGAAMLAVLACGCGGSKGYDAREYKEAAEASKAGYVAPLEDDTADDIMSWVDGHPVTDWSAEIAKREEAVAGYLNDSDAARAEKYGFRSGQNPKMA